MANTNLTCKVCGVVVPLTLANHLIEVHGQTVSDYRKQFPGEAVYHESLLEKFQQDYMAKARRGHPPKLDSLEVEIARIKFPVNIDVDESACLPLPGHYRIPEFGGLGQDIQHAATSLKFGRSIYVWGLPGSGKDAFFHAFSYLTRTPAIIKSVKPGSDIEAWFFTRAFNETGTYWEEGEVLKALRDGYLTSTGRRIPYMFLISDLDRADWAQAEHMRLITDTIQGRIDGSAGKTYIVFPGTIIVATGNTAGSGDERGRMISANPLDASIMERFNARYQFRWLDWRDESEIVSAKFPTLFQAIPNLSERIGNMTTALRDAIMNDDLYGEFSHRGLCSILEHAQDMLAILGNRKIPRTFLKQAARAWVDGLPDEDSRQSAWKIMDPHFVTLDEGDTSHIDEESSLDERF